MVPRPRSQTAWVIRFTLFVAVFSVLAIVDLARGDAVLASVLWLVLVTSLVWAHARNAGGLCAYALDTLAAAFGQHFAQTTDGGIALGELRFGYDLGRHRFVRRTFPLSAVHEVLWRPGQATAVAGKDKNDWHVSILYAHGDPAQTERMRKWSPHPEWDLYMLGFEGPEEHAKALGRDLVAMVHTAGLSLVPGKDDQTFVRGLTRTGNNRPEPVRDDQ
jgi:hypothetical protein